MFNKKTDAGYRTARPGVNFRTLAFGERTHLTEFRLAKGSVIPKHEHPPPVSRSEMQANDQALRLRLYSP